MWEGHDSPGPGSAAYMQMSTHISGQYTVLFTGKSRERPIVYLPPNNLLWGGGYLITFIVLIENFMYCLVHCCPCPTQLQSQSSAGDLRDATVSG